MNKMRGRGKKRTQRLERYSFISIVKVSMTKILHHIAVHLSRPQYIVDFSD